MNHPPRRLRSPLPARTLPILVITLAACGGGGGGGGNSSDTGSGGSRTLNATTAKTQASTSYQASSALLDTSVSTASSVTDTLGTTPIPRLSALLPAGTHRALAVAGKKAGALKAASARRTKAVETERMPCDSGEMVLSWDDRDNDEDMSPADILSFDFSSCRFGDVTTSGRMTMSNMQYQATAGYEEVSLSTQVANLTTRTPTTTDSIDGDFSMRVRVMLPGQDIVEATMSGTRLVSTLNGTVAELRNFESRASINMSTDAYTSTLRADIVEPASGLTTSITTPQALAGTIGAPPTSGSLKTTHQDGSTFTITPISAVNVRLDIDENGDGTVDATEVVPWSTLDRRTTGA